MKPLSLCSFLDTELSLSACCKVCLLVDVVNQAINVSISAAEKTDFISDIHKIDFCCIRFIQTVSEMERVHNLNERFLFLFSEK